MPVLQYTYLLTYLLTYVLDNISSAYKIPFIERTPFAKFENNKSALDNSEFVNEALAGLVETGCVLEVPFLPKVISPLSVSTKNNKKRLILDLRYVNKLIRKERMKFDWSVFQNYVPKATCSNSIFVVGIITLTFFQHTSCFWDFLEKSRV